MLGQCSGLTTLEGHSDSVLSVAISGDGQMIVSGSRDTTLKLWDVETRELMKTIEGHSKGVISVAMSAECHIKESDA